MTTVMLVSEAPALGRVLRPLLAAVPDITFAGEASSEQQALDLADEAYPDVVLLDLALQTADAARLTQLLLRRWSALRVLALCVQPDDPRALDVIAAGAHGCVLLHDADADLIAAVQQVAAGDCWITPCIMDRLLDDYRRLAAMFTPSPVFLHLREHERRTLLLLAMGLSNKEIAQQQGVALSTVKNTLTSVFAKIGVRHRAAAAAFALTHGLAPTPVPRPPRLPRSSA